jgi:uncharacterized damage-inducible protein DinB
MKNVDIQFEAKDKLIQLMRSIEQINLDDYTKKNPILSNSTIGGHVRHIIELFHQLLDGYSEGLVNYDNRQRNLLLQENIDFAATNIADIISQICLPNKKLRVVSLYNQKKGFIETSYDRELMYNIEHCIHHQAIIKIALLSINKFDGDESYGVANSTLEFRRQCAR